ncbi:MAG: PmoA family protein [Verrucomicrobia bacterium]|nr:PmoA family protein [Verrucomicrobiota bacterium]MDA1006767.1 PmoA family protein [Verrucomicrobiota bacterium]
MRILALALLLTAAPLGAQITLDQQKDRLRVEIDGKLFTEYRADKKVPCLYPLISPSGGGLTRNYPLTEASKGEETDHPHHVSMWFTHGLVNGVDFWAQHLARKGTIVHKAFLHSGTESASKGGASTQHASFTVNLSWEEGDTVHLTEVRTYQITASGKTRTIDVTSVLTAPNADAVFGDTKEGSFALRLTPTMRLQGKVAKGSILNSNGEKDGDTWGKRAAWVAYSGPDDSGAPAVVAVFDHPSNLRHPTWWHARDYGLLAANPFGQNAFEGKKDKHLGDYTLKKGESITFRYRVLLHQGDTKSAALEEAMKSFSSEK